jgi:hypothetical protein
MTVSKNFQKYFEYLNTKEQVLFMHNLMLIGSDYNKVISHNTSTSFDDFVSNAFHWSKTDEGHDYWHKISVRDEVPFSTSEVLRDLQEKNRNLKIQLEEYKYEIDKINQSKYMVHK